MAAELPDGGSVDDLEKREGTYLGGGLFDVRYMSYKLGQS